MHMLWSLAVAAVSLAAPVASTAQDVRRTVAIVYSDVCTHADTGDLLGDRVVVLRFFEGDYVFFQTAQGAIQEPLLGTATIDYKNNDIVFKVSASDKSVATFKGKMDGKVLTGKFDNHWTNRSGGELLRLSRIDAGQRDVPECR